MAIVAAGCGDDGDTAASATAVEPVTTARPAAAFAPVIVHHSSEFLYPIAADRFIQHSTLKWRSGACAASLETVATGRVADRKTAGPVPRLQAERLGGGDQPYRRRELDEQCRPSDRTYSTTELTRPYDPGERAAGLRSDSGFYLDVLTDSYDGNPHLEYRGSTRLVLGVPAYYDSRRVEIGGKPGLRIGYWLLYASNERQAILGRDPEAHEGDWELVQVDVQRGNSRNRWHPVGLRIRRFGRMHSAGWERLATVNSHPVLYSSRLSHVPYAVPGARTARVRVEGQVIAVKDESERCPTCAEWRTWHRLVPLRKQPWYGFGGGWGFAFQHDEMSGPLGPYPGTVPDG